MDGRLQEKRKKWKKKPLYKHTFELKSLIEIADTLETQINVRAPSI